MTQTIRRKNCKTRREWAKQLVVHKKANFASSEVPAYRYVVTDDEFFIVEYCGQLMRLPKSEYQLQKGRA